MQLQGATSFLAAKQICIRNGGGDVKDTVRGGEIDARVAEEGELAELVENEAGVGVSREAGLEGLEVVELGGSGGGGEEG